MMRINVGCGEFKAAYPWVNIDHHEPYKPDIIADVFSLPPEVHDVEMAYLGHFLEHIPEDRVVQALTSIKDRMVTGGNICIVGPDVNKANAMYTNGKISKPELMATMKSPTDHAPDWAGDTHYWNCTEERVVDFLDAADFTGVTPVPISSMALNPYPVTARVEWQCAVIAYKLT
jgi:predicted SAM-dependent methyltransferase